MSAPTLNPEQHPHCTTHQTDPQKPHNGHSLGCIQRKAMSIAQTIAVHSPKPNPSWTLPVLITAESPFSSDFRIHETPIANGGGLDRLKLPNTDFPTCSCGENGGWQPSGVRRCRR